MMKQIVVTSTKSKIKIGYEGENQVTKLIFPYDESWLQYGDGEFKIRILRNGDKEAYNATEIVDDRESMTLTMTVTNIELSVKGRGEMQLCYICESGCIKKSPIYEYVVSRSVDSIVAENPPSSSIIPSYITALEVRVGAVENTIQSNIDYLDNKIDETNEALEAKADNTVATQSNNGLMSSEDKLSLDNVITSVEELDSSIDNISNSIDSINNTIGDITDDISGLQSNKLDKSSIDEQFSTTSTNPIQNKTVKSSIDSIEQSLMNKADKSIATQLNDGLMSAIDKSRLDTIYSDYSSALVALGVIDNV